MAVFATMASIATAPTSAAEVRARSTPVVHVLTMASSAMAQSLATSQIAAANHRAHLVPTMESCAMGLSRATNPPNSASMAVFPTIAARGCAVHPHLAVLPAAPAPRAKPARKVAVVARP
jgi:hypothetical protein